MSGHRPRGERTLSRAEARAFYDGFGSRQDGQAFYEDAALGRLVAHAAFSGAARVVEFGCGTGRFAERLLGELLPPAAVYLGVDLSATMVDLARARLARFGGRARVEQSAGEPRLPLAAGSADRFVSNYVLDLLPASEIDAVVREARRLLVAGGRLCVTGLTYGSGPLSRLVSGLWGGVQRLAPKLVGGCRPVRVAGYLEDGAWRSIHHSTVVAFGIPSEVLVAERR